MVIMHILILNHVCLLVEKLVVWKEDGVVEPEIGLEFHGIQNLLNILMNM